MLSRSSAVEAALYERHIPSRHCAGTQPKRRPILLRIAVSVSLCLTLVMLSVLAVARTETRPIDVDPPQLYLPGNPLPANVPCIVPSDKHLFCSIDLGKRKIDFVFDEEIRTISRTVIPTREYTLGQLIVSWGTPTGVSQTGSMTY